MLLRFDPFRDLERAVTEGAPVRPKGVPMDAVRRGNHVIAHLDVPGVSPEALEITVERQTVTVKASRVADVAEEDQTLVGERRHGEFVRELQLGDSLDPNRLEANLEHGVLTLRIPVAETAKPRKVEVSTGAGGGESQTSLTA